MGIVERMVSQEEARRSRKDRELKAAILLHFVVDGDAKYVVRRDDVCQVVIDEMGLQKIIRPSLRADVKAAVISLGGATVEAGNKRLFRGVRLVGSEADAARASRDLRRSTVKRKRGKGQICSGNGQIRSGAVFAEWNRLLEEEGMPANLPEIRRTDAPRRCRSALGLPPDTAIKQTDGVWRQASANGTARAEIYYARQSDWDEALRNLEEERSVVRLTADGMSIRQVASQLQMDRNEVHRVLKRVRTRFPHEKGLCRDAQVGPEGES